MEEEIALEMTCEFFRYSESTVEKMIASDTCNEVNSYYQGVLDGIKFVKENKEQFM